MKSLPCSSLGRSASLLAASLLVASAPLRAADIVKADNTTSLHFTTSWIGEVVPGINDRIVINSLSQNRTAAVGDNLSVQGIAFSAGFQFQINATAGKTLTLGSGGIEVAPAVDVPLIIVAALSASSNQTWSIASGRKLQINGGFSDNGYAIAVNGLGLFDIRGSGTFGSTVTIDTPVSINAAAAVVTLGGNNTMNSLAVPSGRVVGSTLGNFGEPSNFGDGGTNTAITLGNTTNGVLEYTGLTDSSNRTINRDARSPASGIVITNASTTLTLSANMSSGTQTNSGSNGWVFDGAGNLTANGIISNATGAGSTGTTITKNGAGTLTLGGNNTFTGAITINEGTVAIGTTSQRINDAVALDVNAGTFDLNTFSETIGSLAIDGGAALAFDLVTPGNSTALLTVSGAFTKGGASPVSIILSGAVDNGVYKLMTVGSGSLAENMFSVSGATGTFSLADSGNSLVFTAIPEPATMAAGAGLVVLGFAFLRRRRV